MTFLTILATMIVVIIAIIVATPVITKRMVKITSGKTNNGAGAIRLGSTKGYFMCYKDTSGNLHQIKSVINPATGTYTVTENKNLDKCRLDIPTDADEYKITLIGGGGGGSATNAIIYNKNIATEYVTLGEKYVSLIPFRSYWDKLGGPRAILETELRLLEDLDAKIVISQKPRPEGSNPTTAVCAYPIKTIIPLDSTLLSDWKNVKDLRINASCSSKDELLGSITVKYIDSSSSEYDYTNKEYTTNADTSGCYDSAYNKVSNTSISESNYRNYPYFQIKQSSGTPTAALSIPITLSKYALKVFIPNTGGQAGSVVTEHTSFLAPANVNYIEIPKNDIGNGGKGKTALNPATLQEYCYNAATKDGCNGNSGGNTKLTLTAADGNTVTYEAKGGAGGTNKFNEIDIISSEKQYSSGQNGTNPNVTLPSVVLNKLGLNQSQAGYGSDKNCNENAKDKKCNGEDASFIGSGGGSASISYKLSEYNYTAPSASLSASSSLGRLNSYRLSTQHRQYSFLINDSETNCYYFDGSTLKNKNLKPTYIEADASKQCSNISTDKKNSGIIGRVCFYNNVDNKYCQLFAGVNGIETQPEGDKLRGRGGNGAPGAIIIEW